MSTVLKLFDTYHNKYRNVLLDPEDYDKFCRFKWRIDKCGYARRVVWRKKDDGTYGAKTLLLHRCVLGVENESAKFECVDHINGDRLDNRKENLRAVSYSENAANRHKILASTGFLRISEYNGKYIARVRKDGISRYIGTFGTPEEAEAALLYFQNTGETVYPLRKIRPVVQRTIDGKVIEVFNNCSEAADRTGICSVNINRVANHDRRRKQAGGFLWTFLEEMEAS